VLLEINQSCSLHTDSDLDKVVKGDAVMDAFGMAAADERWLLEHFLASLRQDLAANGCTAAGTEAGGDTAPAPVAPAAPQRETPQQSEPVSDGREAVAGRTGTFADERWCLNDITRALGSAVANQRAAEAEAAALFRLYQQSAVPPHARAHVLAVNGGTDAKPAVPADGAAAAAAAAATGSLAAPVAAAPATPLPLQPQPHPQPLRLETIPWVPLPPRTAILQAFAAAWQEELWFGGGLALQKLAAPKRGALGSGGGGSSSDTPPAAAPTGGSLATIPCLSTRALLVLLLRRMYERVHTGGFERLLPPPTPELAERYRAVAEFVPSNLRET
jgi:hypothetical protein